MSVTKQYVKFTPNTDGTLACIVSKEKTPYSLYVVENGVLESDTWKMYIDPNDLSAIKTIWENLLKDNQKNIQPTPIFYFEESRTFGMNIANWITSSFTQKSPRGLGSIAYLAPIILTSIKPTRQNNIIGKTQINSANAYILYITNKNFMTGDENSGEIIKLITLGYLCPLTYKPHKDISLDPQENAITVVVDTQVPEYNANNRFIDEIFLTSENVVKHINRKYLDNNSPLFINSPNLQFNDDVMQYPYTFNAYANIIQEINMKLPILYESSFALNHANGQRTSDAYSTAIPYTNFYDKTAEYTKKVLSIQNFDVGTETRAFVASIMHERNNIDTSIILDVKTDKKSASFYFLHRPYKIFISYYTSASILPSKNISQLITNRDTAIEFSSNSYIFSVQYFFAKGLKGNSSTTLSSGKVKGKSGFLFAADRTSITSINENDSTCYPSGQVFYLIDDNGENLYKNHTCYLHVIFPTGSSISSSYSKFGVLYIDGTVDEIDVIGRDIHPIYMYANRIIIENGTKLYVIDYNSITIEDFKLATFDRMTAYFTSNTYIFQNVSNKKIKKVYAYCKYRALGTGRDEKSTTQMFFILKKNPPTTGGTGPSLPPIGV